MGYFLRINNKTWLANPWSYYKELQPVIDCLEKQGCKLDDDGLTHKPFKIKDLNSLVIAAETVARNLAKSDTYWADFNEIINDPVYDHEGALTFEFMQALDYAPIFMSANLLKLVGEKNYIITYHHDEEKGGLKPVYTLREGAKCTFKAE